MDTLVVFIENENGHLNLVKSLDMLDIEYKRLFEDGVWTTYFNKLQIYVDGLKDIDNEWVLLSDSRDVLFYKDINDLNNEDDVINIQEIFNTAFETFKTIDDSAMTNIHSLYS